MSSLQPSRVNNSSHHRSIWALYSVDWELSDRRVYDLHNARTRIWRWGDILEARGRGISDSLGFFELEGVADDDGCACSIVAWMRWTGTRGRISLSCPTFSNIASSHLRHKSPLFLPEPEIVSNLMTARQSSLFNSSSSFVKAFIERFDHSMEAKTDFGIWIVV